MILAACQVGLAVSEAGRANNHLRRGRFNKPHNDAVWPSSSVETLWHTGIKDATKIHKCTKNNEKQCVYAYSQIFIWSSSLNVCFFCMLCCGGWDCGWAQEAVIALVIWPLMQYMQCMPHTQKHAWAHHTQSSPPQSLPQTPPKNPQASPLIFHPSLVAWLAVRLEYW